MADLIAVGSVLIGAFVAAIGTVVVKKGTNRYSFLELWKTRYLWLGALAYCFSTVFYVLALHKEALSVVYPIASTTYIWTTFLSVKYLGERMTKWKWIGLGGIVLGVMFIGIGS